MKTPIRPLPRLLAAALLTATLAAPAAASHPDSGSPLQFVVGDQRTRQQLDTLNIAEPLDLGVGEEVVIQPVLPNGRRDIVPRVRYSVSAGKNNVHIATVRNNASALLVRGLRHGNDRNGTSALIKFELVDRADRDRLRPNQRDGYISVRVLPQGFAYDRPGVGVAPIQDPRYARIDERRAYRVVDALYRGILLRSPEDAQTGRVREITEEGYNTIEQIAVDIAESDESRRLYSQTSDEERLAAVYRHLLGVERNQIPSDEWARAMNAMRFRRLGEVVAQIVRDQDFVNRFDLQEQYSRYR
jgi:hypothetical protein